MKHLLLILVCVILTSTAFSNAPHIVLVMLECKSGKEEEFKKALVTVAEKSRSESSCLEYHIHQNPDDKTKFAIYEKWVSPELHKQQFSKSYVLKFATIATPLLSQPYIGFFGSEL